MKTISVNLEVPIYKTILNVIISDSVFKCFKYLGAEKEFEEDFLKEAHAMFAGTDKGHWVLAFDKKHISQGTIAHECFHAACAIMKAKGIKYSDKSEESFAYLLDFLVAEINRIFKENNLWN